MNSSYLVTLITFLIIMTSCSNPKDSGSNLKNSIAINYQNQKEIICLVANSEINQFIDATKKRKEFDNSQYLKTLEIINEQLKNDCNINQSVQNFNAYLSSGFFKEEIKNLTLSNDFLTKKMTLISDAENEQEALEEVVRTIAEITFHKENEKMGLYSRSAIQRLHEFSNNTLELKRNVSYNFPTSFFINENLLSSKNPQYGNVIIRGGNKVGSTEVREIDVPYSNGILALTTKLTIKVKTIK